MGTDAERSGEAVIGGMKGVNLRLSFVNCLVYGLHVKPIEEIKHE